MPVRRPRFENLGLGGGLLGDAPRHFLPLAAITFMLWLGSSILVPVLPLYTVSLGLSYTETGVVVGAFFGGRMVCNLLGGHLADRFAIRSVAATGCIVTAAASAWAGLADTYLLLVVARAIQGGGAGIYLTAALAAVIRVSPKESVGKYVSLYQGIGLLGFAVGPAIGGAVGQVAGLRAPFFAYSLVALFGLILAIASLPKHRIGGEVAHDEPADGTPAIGLLQVVRSRAFVMTLVIALVIFWVRAGIMNNLVPILAEEQLQMNEATIGLMFSVAAAGNVAVLGHAGRALDRNRRPVVVWSTAASGVLTLTIGFLGSPWLLVIGMLLLAMATGYASVSPMVLAADIATTQTQGRAVGVLRVATDFALMAGPVVAGALSDDLGLRTAMVVAGAFVLITAVATRLLLPETRPPSSQLARPS